MNDFFISYNRADRTWAEWIAWHLEAEGYSVVIQAWDFRPGGNFVLDMQSATGAERTIAVLSPDYLTSEFTAPEWAAAFAQDPTGKESKLLPVRVRECELKGLLRPIVYIDLLKLDEAAAKRTLLAGVSRGRTKPAESRVFPARLHARLRTRRAFPTRRLLYGTFLICVIRTSQDAKTNWNNCAHRTWRVRRRRSCRRRRFTGLAVSARRNWLSSTLIVTKQVTTLCGGCAQKTP